MSFYIIFCLLVSWCDTTTATAFAFAFLSRTSSSKTLLTPTTIQQPLAFASYSRTHYRSLVSFSLKQQQSQDNDDVDNDESCRGLLIDPLLHSVLLLQEEEDEASSLSLFLESSSGGSLRHASLGIQVWKRALQKGRLPITKDFDDKNNTTTCTTMCWPTPPLLYDKLYDAMVKLELPRFTQRHVETIPLVVRSIIRLTMEYSNTISMRASIIEEQDGEPEDVDEEDYTLFDNDDWQDDDDNYDDNDDYLPPQLQDEDIADELVSNIIMKEWSDVVNGVQLLDTLFGYNNHDLLQAASTNDDASGASLGFGIHHGIWSHSGWQEIPKLQQQISKMPELRKLVQILGRRPSADEQNAIHKFVPRKQDKEGGLGAEFDPQQRESVSGITLSGNLSEMIPSEAVLLQSSSILLRRLFMAKMTERKLLSYQLSGWTDVPSIPRTRPLYMNRMPSGPGGPIVVCLDTSWSMMTGIRESLSKAVVLACVSAAHKQGRECQVVAFSTERQVMETGIITADAAGVQRLLAFLSHSFGGGTDVTGALKFAMTTMTSSSSDSSSGDTTNIMSAADMLLVTDGEIPDPPVSNDIMEALDRLKLQQGVEIHGLLIGKAESKPLSRLCTHTHDFLSQYDYPQQPMGKNTISNNSGDMRSAIQKGRMATALHARRSFDDDVVGGGGRWR